MDATSNYTKGVRQKDKYHIVSLDVALKIWHKCTICRTDRLVENRLVVAKAEGREGKDWEFGVEDKVQIYRGWINK